MDRRAFIGYSLATITSSLYPTALRAETNYGQLVTGYSKDSLSGIIIRNLSDLINEHSTTQYRPKSISGDVQQKALRYVASQTGDGLHLVLTIKGPFVISPYLQKRKLVEIGSDLIPISKVCEVPLILAVGANVPSSVKSIAEYIQWLKNNPEGVYFGVSGYGSSFHFLSMNFTRESNALLKFIHYSSTAAIMQDLKSGHINAGVLFASQANEIESVRAIAISSPSRWLNLEDIQTFNEQNFKQCNIVESFGVYAPSSCNSAKVAEINALLRKVVVSREFTEFCHNSHLRPTPSTETELLTEIKAEQHYWEAQIKQLGLEKIDD